MFNLTTENCLKKDVVKFLYRGNLTSTIAAILLAIILSCALHGHVEHSHNLTWLILLTVIYIIRYLILHYRITRHPDADAKNLIIFRFCIIFSSCAWGLASILVFPEDVAHQQYMFLTLVGVCGGCTIIYSFDRKSAMIFPVSISLFCSYNYFKLDTSFGLALLLNTVIFMTFVTIASAGIARQLRESVELRLSEEKTRRDLSLLSQRQQLHIEHTPLAVIEMDTTLTITFWNAAASKMFGFSSEEAVGSNIALILPQSKIETFTRHMIKLIEGDARVHMHSSNLTKQDGVIYCEWFNTIVKDENGMVSTIAALVQDETAYVKARKEIEQQAYYDVLTHLPNSRLLNDRIQLAQSKSERNKRFGCIIYIDIDNFKLINDSYGHAAGDRLLISIAQRFKKLLRGSDTAARIGGDEFIILLEDIHGEEETALLHCVVVANKILEAICRPINLDHTTFTTSASLGICLFIDKTTSAENLIRRADSAMYAAKQSGKSQFQFYDSKIQETADHHNQLKNDLQSAIQNNELTLHYQPQIDKERKIIGAEALLRWQHPAFGFVPPFEFIPLAEETKAIVPIGEWVFTEACKQLAAWQQADQTKHFKLSVNVSAIQFNQTNFISCIMDAIEKTQCDPKGLIIELTESAILDSFEEIVPKMNQLKTLGIAFSLDDFGTGHSSLSVLRNLPLDELKIDRSFVSPLPDNTEDEAIVQTIIAMGKSLSLSIIAEGVETEEQASLLLESGCHNLQGYLFSKPVTIEAFNELLE